MSDVVSREPLRLPELRQDGQMPFWPAWVASRIASLKHEQQPDPETGTWRTVTTLPGNLALRQVERDELVRHAEALREILGCTLVTNRDAEHRVLRAVTAMLMAFPSASASELTSEARGEAFVVALADVPASAVEAAINRWYRGECGADERGNAYDYRWWPTPAILRRISQQITNPYKLRLHQIEQVLSAEELIEYSEEHCRMMRAKLQELFCTFKFSPVGETAAAKHRGDEPR